MTTQTTPETEATVRPVQKRAEKTRMQVIEAVVVCLDRHGYSDTSISVIQAEAGVSRGTMTHHFPTRQSMIVAAAQYMLDNALLGVERNLSMLTSDTRGASETDVVHRFWANIVNTPEGHAFIEVMIAARTDIALRDLLTEMFDIWEDKVRAVMRENYGPLGGQIGAMWDLSRTFLQGLLLQAHIAKDRKTVEDKIALFAKLLAQYAMSMGHAQVG